MDLSIAMMTKIFNGEMWKAAIFPVITLPNHLCSTSKGSYFPEYEAGHQGLPRLATDWSRGCSRDSIFFCY
ncbi:hypothetical protein PFLUV_G00196730 [Perca fluviatilis]|uniref:Uncharacterized protein n=1 Tax=Perca fluviatilis TaxID=8168 RepID=A0A6A5EKY4_PERFL|nr:hypothetical protein PFLUV_G00196730 [Perca fluviatilis]